MSRSHESAFERLPHLMAALCQSNPGTMFEFERNGIPSETGVVFEKLFGHLVRQLKFYSL